MAIGNTPYSSDRYAASHELALGRLTPTASTAADEVIGRHRFFTGVKVLEARGHVMVKGKGTTSKFDIYKGTTSIGALAIGTASAGSVVDASLTDTDFLATDDLVVKNAIETDTGSAFVTIQYQEAFTG